MMWQREVGIGVLPEAAGGEIGGGTEVGEPAEEDAVVGEPAGGCAGVGEPTEEDAPKLGNR
jgi:hypothetical protein